MNTLTINGTALDLKEVNGVMTMSSLQLASLCVGDARNAHSDFTTKAKLVLGKDSRNFSDIYLDSMNRKQDCLALPEREACLMAMSYSYELQAQVYDAWQSLVKQSQQIQVPTTMHAALQLAADQALQLELAAPKVAFVDKYVTAEGNKGFREVAKLLQVNEREFREFLSEDKIMYKLAGGWVPHSNHIKAGRFYVTTGIANDHVFTESKFTPKGIAWVDGLMKDLAENK